MGGRRPTGWRDALLPGALALGSVLELALVQPSGWQTGTAFDVAACTLLVFRRRLAAVVCPLSCLTLFVIPYLGPPLDEGSVPIAILTLAQYSLGRYTTLVRGLAGVAVVYAGLTLVYLTVDQRMHGLGDVLFVLALFFPPFVLGRVVRRMAAQREQLLLQQEWIEREAARGERMRIARELHDVLAHSLSAMVVQATAARDVVRTDPAAAEVGLDAVTEAGRAALAETGRLLHVLRDDTDELALGPAPTLARLDTLVADFRRRGLDVTVESAPDLQSLEVLPPPLGVSAYRIVQESLTNALRHSTDGTATVRVDLAGDRLTVATSNPYAVGREGRPPWSRVRVDGSGLGLAGIAERVALFDGTLDHGVRDGRYALRATLTVPAAEIAEALPASRGAESPGRDEVPERVEPGRTAT